MIKLMVLFIGLCVPPALPVPRWEPATHLCVGSAGSFHADSMVGCAESLGVDVYTIPGTDRKRPEGQPSYGVDDDDLRIWF